MRLIALRRFLRRLTGQPRYPLPDWARQVVYLTVLGDTQARIIEEQRIRIAELHRAIAAHRQHPGDVAPEVRGIYLAYLEGRGWGLRFWDGIEWERLRLDRAVVAWCNLPDVPAGQAGRAIMTVGT